jgi:hypothetical protein
MYKQAPKSPILKALVGNQPNLPEGLREAIEATPNKMMDSPTKMNKGERYDMKMASDQNLRPSARKNYAENAEAAQKSSPTKQTFSRKLPSTNAGIVNPESSFGRTLPGSASGDFKKMPYLKTLPGKIELKVTKKKKPVTIKPRAKEEIAKIPVKTASIPQSKSKSKLAVVNTTKPAEPKTKKQVRRAKRADKLESRAEKLRGTAQKSSPTKQTKKVLTPKAKKALLKTFDDISKKDFKKRIEGTKKPVTPSPTSRADNKEYLEGQKRKILTSKSKR